MHNRISCLKKEDGSRLEAQKYIEKELVSYYEDLLTEENHSREEAIQLVTNQIHYLVTEHHNASLMHPITLQEVDIAFIQMKEGTTTSPDGFTIDFFTHVRTS
jgi:hypothetical protein